MSHGRIYAVTEESLGSWLATDATSGAAVLYLYDVSAFDADGGSLSISDETNTDTLTYTGVDYEADALTGVSGLSYDFAADDTAVQSEPVAYERTAEVQLDDEDDTLAARVPHALYDRLALGFYDRESGETPSVVVEFDGQEWVVTDVLGVYPVIDGSFIDPDSLPTPPLTDGDAPASSPTPTVLGGPRYLAVQWDAITNADPVTYEVHLDTSSGFTADATTLIAEMDGTIVYIRQDADGNDLSYDTDYYVKLIAKDADGSASAGTETGPTQLDRNGTDDILAGSVTAEKLAAVLVLASTIKTADTGQRVEVSTDGIRLVASDGSTIVYLPTDEDQPAQFNGSVVASDLTSLTATLRGVNTLDQSASMTLQSYQADPSAAPSLTQDFDSASDFGTDVDDLQHGLWWDGANFWYVHSEYSSGFTHELVKVNSSGVEQSRTTLSLPAGTWLIRGVVKIGSYWYGLGVTGGVYKLLVWSDSSGVPGTRTASASWAEWNGVYDAAITTDGTSVYLAQSNITPIGGNNKAWLGTYTAPGDGTKPVYSSNVLTSTSVYGASNIMGVYYGSADIGATRWLVMTEGVASVGSFNTSGTSQTNEYFEQAFGSHFKAGLTYNGSKLCELYFDLFTLYSGHQSSGATSEKTYVAYSWNDDDATGGTHESGLSPRASITWKNRYRLSVTWPSIPDNGGTDDANSVNIYAKVNASDPGSAFASYKEQAMDQTGTQAYLNSYSTATTGGQDTSFSGTGTPGYITPGSNATAFAPLRGNGDGFIPVGSITMFGGTSAPTGWLLCDGTSYLRATYPNLFAAIGTKYGSADGTHFNVPDMGDKMVAGYKSGGTVSDVGVTGGAGSHNSQGGHTHDGHGAVIGSHTINSNTTTGGGANRASDGGHAGTHSSDGAHSHNAHSLSNAPAWVGVAFIIKY